ncbi:hypothetical protein JAAARDRAFT_193028 [Jaapia argillacea MUCL 33604]|uniref:Protein kinase domain-containing protein n=1 Tax=Jaapia argillacea MUCL 33604 TaxID=933084 RepID=A0A067Q4Q1_9AGAM|nr:hypothetical protein JAAARDRAFT_193028 [Jaapia argillacea MUCL 33604]
MSHNKNAEPVERKRVLTAWWRRDPDGSFLPRPPPAGVRPPNQIIWGHSLLDFFWMERKAPSTLITAWSRSMIKEYGVDYTEDEFDEPEPIPRLRRPWPLLKLPRGIKVSPPLGAVDEGSDHDGCYEVLIDGDSSEESSDELSDASSTHSLDQSSPVTDPPSDLPDDEPMTVPNDPDNPIYLNFNGLRMVAPMVWSPKIREELFVTAHPVIRADLLKNYPPNMRDGLVAAASRYDAAAKAKDEARLAEEERKKAKRKGKKKAGMKKKCTTTPGGAVPPFDSSTLVAAEIATSSTSEPRLVSAPERNNVRKTLHAYPLADLIDLVDPKHPVELPPLPAADNDPATTDSLLLPSDSKEPPRHPESADAADPHGPSDPIVAETFEPSNTESNGQGTRFHFLEVCELDSKAVKHLPEIPKLEEFIPEQYFPDFLMVHDPDDLTSGGHMSGKAGEESQASGEGDGRKSAKVEQKANKKKPVKYRRIYPVFNSEQPSDRSEDSAGAPPPRIGHLYLSDTDILGEGHHSCVYRAEMKLPRPLSARSPNKRVAIAAKIPFRGDSPRALLDNEAKIYNQFPKHMMEDWCGYNLVTPSMYPTPVCPVVPKFYGYWVPAEEDEDSDVRRGKRKAEPKVERRPILLMEQCGVPITPETLTKDEKYVMAFGPLCLACQVSPLTPAYVRSECMSLLLRLHLEDVVHGSIYLRNICIQPGPLTAHPLLRTTKTPSFRIIDFGRSKSWEWFWDKGPDKGKGKITQDAPRGPQGVVWSRMKRDEINKARGELQLRHWEY